VPRQEQKGVRNPLQLLGWYLAWMEGIAGGGLLLSAPFDHWTKYFLLFAIGFGILAYGLTAAFVVIYLAVKNPNLLFNPSDYDPTVQHQLFGTPASKIEVRLDDELAEPLVLDAGN